MRTPDVDEFVETYGLAAICAVLFAKAAGVPIPIPGDLILLATAAQAASGRFLLGHAFVAVLAALVLGGVVQFVVIRGSGRRLVYRFGRYVGLTEPRLDRAAAAVRRSGVLGITLAVLTPGLRTAAIPACGLASIPWRTFVPALVLGTGLDLTVHFALGFAGGQLIVSRVGADAVGAIAVAAVVVCALVGLAVWLLLRRRRRQHVAAGDALADAFGAWEQAACPVCLSVSVFQSSDFGLPSSVGPSPAASHGTDY
jgi:membrane protein DedA with SNARE-associated domain